jgi:endonuclease-3 related protein
LTGLSALDRTFGMQSAIYNIYTLLLKEFGPQGWWPVAGTYFPPKENRFEIILGAVLTQNTSWYNAATALESLRSRGLIDAKKIIGLSKHELALCIKPSGYYNQKADRLKKVCEFYLSQSQSGLVPSREKLLAIKGIGPETADSILLYAYHVPIFVVDAYTRRTFSRIGQIDEKNTYSEIQDVFTRNLPRNEKLYNECHALIVKHGKDVCRKKPLCEHCVIGRVHLCNHYN